MVAHAFHRIAAPLQCLAQQLRLLELRGVDLARIEAAGEISELLGRVVLAVAETLGDDMEAVDEAPGEVARERLEPRVAKHVEQRRHHHFHRCAGLLGIGHLALLDRKSVVWGKSVSVRVALGGRRNIKTKKRIDMKRQTKRKNNKK